MTPGARNWNLTKMISLVLLKTGPPPENGETSDSPFAHELAERFIEFYRERRYANTTELRWATMVAWKWLSSPTSRIAPDVWREVFATTGPIAHGRSLPQIPMEVYRIAPAEAATGWSWTMDPTTLLTDPLGRAAPQWIFEETARQFPDRQWHRTTLDPRHVLMTIAFGADRIGGAISIYTSDEVVVDPVNLGSIEHVSIEEMRRTYFQNLVFDKSTRRWSTETHQAELARQAALGLDQVT